MFSVVKFLVAMDDGRTNSLVITKKQQYYRFYQILSAKSVARD